MKRIIVGIALTKFLFAGIDELPIKGIHVPFREITCNEKTYPVYHLGDKVAQGNPLLRDLFAGKASLAPVGSEKGFDRIQLKFATRGIHTWDAKVPIFRVDGDKAFYTFVRGYDGNTFSIYLMKSSDGISFEETPGNTSKEKSGNVSTYNANAELYDNYIDPTLSVDFSTCPPTVRMTAECSNGSTGRVDVCESHSQTPLDLSTWSKMIPLVTGDNARHSGSTGALLLVEALENKTYVTKRYVKWTDVQNEEGKVTTVGMRNDALRKLGKAGDIGTTLMGAERFPCKGGWDCNNRDGQDWKREGSYYYVAYNGANSFTCAKPTDSSKNIWGLSFGRALEDPLRSYTLLKEPLLLAERQDNCGMSYPYVNVVDGEIYVYYTYYEVQGAWPGKNHVARSKLVCNPGAVCGK